MDAKTGEPVPSAIVRVAGTSKGTITNLDGTYLISLPSGDYTLIYSHVGYQSDSASVRLTGNIHEDVNLEPADILLPEIVSVAEDPAYAIIRKAIAKKHEWEKLLKSYSFKAFTRLIIYRDTSLAGITESYTDGYWQEGDSLHEVVTQKRETKNLPEAGLIPSVGEIVNFTDDVIEFVGYKFVGPIAENALDYYKYKLLRTFRKNGVEVYEIEVIPDSRLIPLFSGRISIADSSFAVMGIDFHPNEAFHIPFISDLKLNFAQHYSLYENRFWMPTNIITELGMKIQLLGMSLPRLSINEVSDIYDYNLNNQIADSIFKKPTLIIDSSSTTFDSTFWSSHEVLPLTVTEQKAYKTLDSTQTLAKQFKPTGATATLFGQGGIFSFFNYVDVRFNRVEGLFLGGKYTYSSGKKQTKLTISNEGSELSQTSDGWRISLAAGYGISDKIFKWRVGGAIPFGEDVKHELGAEIYRDIGHYPQDDFFSSLTTTITSLFGCNDYYNYYMTNGWDAHYSIVPLKHLDATVTYLSENETSVVNHTNFYILSFDDKYRPNPPIMDGMMRSMKFNVRYGDERVPLDVLPVNAVEAERRVFIAVAARKRLQFRPVPSGGIVPLRYFLEQLPFPAADTGHVCRRLFDRHASGSARVCARFTGRRARAFRSPEDCPADGIRRRQICHDFVGTKFPKRSVSAARYPISLQERNGNFGGWFRGTVVAERYLDHKRLVLRSRHRFGENFRIDSHGLHLPFHQTEQSFLQRRNEQPAVSRVQHRGVECFTFTLPPAIHSLKNFSL